MGPKCYKCGGSHLSELHDQRCPQKHAVAGICDCGHFKCLNCHKTGHNCRDTRCLARDLFHPHMNCKSRKPKSNGKDRDWAPEGEPNRTTGNPTLMDPSNDDGDLYTPALLPPNPTSRQVRKDICDRAIAILCRPFTSWLDGDEGASGSYSGITYDPEQFPEALNFSEPMDTDLVDLVNTRPIRYSPSCPQGDTTNLNLA
jgi:hypothetical protein